MYNGILCLKVNGYIIRGNNFAVFTFASHLSLAEGGSRLIKELALFEQIYLDMKANTKR